MPKTLKLILLSIRDLLVSVGPVAFIVAGLLVLAYWWLDPQPPRQVTLATGPAGSAYAEFGKRYAAALKPNGIEVILKPTDGSLDNLELLRKGEADVAFVRGGSADPVADEEAGLTSLGALFYEPMWVFYRSDAALRVEQRKKKNERRNGNPELNALVQLKGFRLNIDKPGSGVPQVVEQLLRANRIDPQSIELSYLEQTPATEALEAGGLDPIVLASAPQSPLVQKLLRAPGIELMNLEQGEA